MLSARKNFITNRKFIQIIIIVRLIDDPQIRWVTDVSIICTIHDDYNAFV